MEGVGAHLVSVLQTVSPGPAVAVQVLEERKDVERLSLTVREQ